MFNKSIEFMDANFTGIKEALLLLIDGMLKSLAVPCKKKIINKGNLNT